MENSSEQPSVKRRRVEEKNSNCFRELPDFIFEKIIAPLSVSERIRMERVDWYLNETMRKIGWKKQRMLSYGIVFDGAEWVIRSKFNNESLVALFKRMAEGLSELDLGSFIDYKLRKNHQLSITSGICASISLLPKLSKIDIWGFDLLGIVPFLPESLREIRSNCTDESLSALAGKCSRLEAMHFFSDSLFEPISVPCLNDFLHKYPKLKKLHFDAPYQLESGTISAFEALNELEDFELHHQLVGVPFFDKELFGAVVKNCKQLRRLAICGRIPIHEESLSGLEELPNLVELCLPGEMLSKVMDSAVEAISKCRNLKKLDIANCKKLTDDAIVCLVQHCKALVSLNVQDCSKITEKSLAAIVAEMDRRHGDPLITLPEGPFDDGIFHFQCQGTKISGKKAFYLTADNPWLKLDCDFDNDDSDEINIMDEELSITQTFDGEEEMEFFSDEELDDEEEFSGTDEELDEEDPF